jgi:PPP family 3-phenylpropionic acid transporter
MSVAPTRALSLFYLTWFAGFGIYLPYLNLYLDRVGLSGLQIGIVSALVPLSGLLIPPIGGLLADRLGRRRGLVVMSSLLALFSFSFMFAVRSFIPIAVVLGCFAVVRAPALPLVEASAIEHAEAGGTAYGRMRAWGSIAFIVVALGAGKAVGLWGVEVVLVMMTVLLGLIVLSTFGLPADRIHRGEPRTGGGLLAMLGRRQVIFFLLACMLSQAAHGPYYVFYTIHLERAGYATLTIGLLWAIAVGCEILVMLRMPVLLKRFGPLPVIAVALLIGVFRWTICARTTAPAMMIVAQVMHAATYAAFHVAAVTHTHRLFGKERGASGQAIYSAATYGLGNVLGMVLSGIESDRLGFQGLFGVAAGVALLGAILVPAAMVRSGVLRNYNK